MTYIENIFICMVSPLLVAALCMGRRQLRFFLFCIAGMGGCLLSAYINTFLVAVCRADALAATAEIAPVVEEIMKLLPLVFYLLVFDPEGDKIKVARHLWTECRVYAAVHGADAGGGHICSAGTDRRMGRVRRDAAAGGRGRLCAGGRCLLCSSGGHHRAVLPAQEKRKSEKRQGR